MPRKSLLSLLFGKPLALIVIVAIVVGVALLAQNVPTGFQTTTTSTAATATTAFTSSVSQKTTNSVAVSWSQPSVSFTFYRLNQRTCGSGDSGWQWKGDITSSNPRFTSRTNNFTGLLTNACYDFRVIAMSGTTTSYSVAQFTIPQFVSANATTTTAATRTITTLASAPLVAATSPTPNSVQLFWTTPSGLPSGTLYKVEVRPPTSETFQTYLTTQSTTTTVSALTPGTTYSFRVTAVTTTGIAVSQTSSAASATTTATAVTEPTTAYATRITETTSSSAAVTWSAFSGTAFYRANQRTCGSGDSGWLWRGDITQAHPLFMSRTFNYTNLQTGTCYEFRVIPFGGTTTSPAVILDFAKVPVVKATPRAIEITPTPVTGAPTVVISHSPTSPTEGQAVTITAAATPVSGATISNLQISVDTVNVESVCVNLTGGGASCKYQTSDLTAGTHTYSATATDSLEKTAIASGSLTVSAVVTPGEITDRVNPTVVVSVNPTSAAVNQEITFTAAATDDVGLRAVEIYVDDTKIPATCSAPVIRQTTTGAVVALQLIPLSVPTGAATLEEAVTFPLSPDLGKSILCTFKTKYPSAGSHTYYALARDTSRKEARDPALGTRSFDVISPVSGDTTPPTVLVSHAPSSPTVGTTVTYAAKAVDNAGVANLEIYVDGQKVLARCPSREGITPQVINKELICFYSTAYEREGTHTYYAEATDVGENKGRDLQSGENSLTVVHSSVGDREPPKVSVSHILLGTRAGQQVLFTAKASDNVALRSVEIFVDNAKVNARCSATVGIPLTPPSIPTAAAIAAPGLPVISPVEEEAQTVPTTPVSFSNVMTCSYTAPFAVGAHTYYAVATDIAANSARDPATKGFTITSTGIVTQFILAGRAQSQTTVALQWTAVEGAGAFRVQYKPAAAITPPRIPSGGQIAPPSFPPSPDTEGWITLADVRANSYLANVPRAGIYNFRVIALSRASQQIATSNVITVDTTKVPPPPPPRLAIELKAGTPTADSVPLTWTAYKGTGLSRYIIQIKKSSETEFNVYITTVPEKLFETVSALEATTEYNFRVDAVNSDNKILASSNVVTAKTAAPPTKDLTLSVGEVKKTKAELKWNKYDDPKLSFYTIQFRQVGEEIWKFKDNAKSTDISIIVKGLRPRTDYEFKLLALSGEVATAAATQAPTGRAIQLPKIQLHPAGTVIGESNVVKVTTETPPGLNARKGTVGADRAEINWDVYSIVDDDVTVPILFTVVLKEVSVDTDFNAVGTAESAETIFTITSLKSNTDYEARVDVYGIGSTYYIGSSNSVPFTTGDDGNLPPVANAGADKECNARQSCNFDGSSSSDPDGTITSYIWNFGDGSSATGVTTSHVYTTPTTYVTTLVVTDDKGAQANDDLTVTVKITGRGGEENPPIPVLDAVPTSGNAPLPVSFSAQGSVDADGEIISYEWDFGDGQIGSGETTSHIYTTAGTYIVSLIVIDNDGYAASAQETITVTSTQPDVNDPPVANAGADVECLVNVPCNIDGSGSTDPDPEDVNLLTYLWDFGDGTIQEAGISVGHTFTTPGTYTITLTVTDPDGAFSIDSAEVTVQPQDGDPVQSPLAVISAYPTSGNAPLLVSFDASGSSDPDNEIVAYGWDFGDGEAGTGIIATHEYTSSGSYIVFLSVTDATGQVGTNVIQIAVGEAEFDEPYLEDEIPPELGGDLLELLGPDITGGFGRGPPVFPTTQPIIGDSDGDFIPDNLDACPGTFPGESVTANGCPLGSTPTKSTCTANDFKRERVLIGVDVSSIANSCGQFGIWKVDVFRTEPSSVEVGGGELPSPRDACSQIVPGWQSGVDIHRVYCGIDNQWYYVPYTSSFKQD